MTAFDTVLADVFDREAEARIADPAEERATIAAAKAGDESATLALIYAYAPVLRNCVSRYRNAGDAWDGWTLVSSQNADEARMIAVGGLLEAVKAFDLGGPHERLAATVWEYVTRSFSDSMAAMEGGASIPPRTLTRFYGILNRADRDVAEAERIAPEYAMTRETFRAVLDAVKTGRIEEESLTEAGAERVAGEARPLWSAEDGFAAAEDRILCETAFAAVETDEADVVRHAYGFATGEPLSDMAIVYALTVRDLGVDRAVAETVVSRATVQRLRTGALVKMRAALAVDA